MSNRSLVPCDLGRRHPSSARVWHSTRTPAVVLALASFLLPLGCAASDLPDPIYLHGFEGDCGTLLFAESFFDSNAAEWPAAWTELANSADVANVTSGDGRLRPVISGYSLGRMVTPITTRDVDVLFSMVMEDASAQGVGFYVRQNGGHLQLTNPSGQGYAIFVEGSFRGLPGVGLWRELDGNESQLFHSGASVATPQSGIRYRVRFRVSRIDAVSTRLQGRFWPATDPEPAAWQVEVIDATPALQAISGGIAVDSWNVATSPATITAHTRVDDIEVRALCPLSSLPPAIRQVNIATR